MPYCCMSLSEKSSKLVVRYNTEEICFRKVSFTVSNFFCRGWLSGYGKGCVCKVKFQLAAPARPILGFAHALFRAVEQVDLVQSGTLAQLHDLNTQVPHGLGCAGVLHAL